MWGVIFLRLFFILIFTGIACSLGYNNPFLFGSVGLVAAVLIVTFETFSRRVSLKGLSSSVFGILLGMLLSWMFGEALNQLSLTKYLDINIIESMKIFASCIFVYLGLTLGLKGKDEFNLVIPYVKFKSQELGEGSIIIDTSIIIDGRILDIVKTNFVEGKFIIPRFVLNELHVLSDSTDHMKRQKGKRGINILHSLKKETGIEIEIYDHPVDEVKTVDEKLVKLGQKLEARVLTTDYNLNQIAQLQGVKVLNINDLANALKPTFVSGQHFSLKLIKEGKEHNQAVGYLEDGTMVVVESARKLIGKTVSVEVTSVLQSSSGRIVFTKLT